MTSDDMVRIAIVGPECSGKTDLAMQLASHYNTLWVPEFARNYIDRLERPYEKEDLVHIARWQVSSEDELALQANRVLICDTTILVIKVWSEYKYGLCDPDILTLHHSHRYNHYLLTHPDVPWEDDPQREHPDKREYFFQRYKTELASMGVPFTEINGERSQRLSTAVAVIDAWIG